MLIDAETAVLKIIGFSPTGDLGPLTGYTSKRRKAVWYLKAPPDKPPTCWQIAQRNKFRALARVWTALQPSQRASWMEAARKARLSITGYNLFIWYQLRQDTKAIETIQRQSGINVLT